MFGIELSEVRHAGCEKGPGLTKFCVVRKLIFAIRIECFFLARPLFFLVFFAISRKSCSSRLKTF